MIIIPAIDIRGGRCVRLRQGDYTQETLYDEDPVSIALQFADAGAARVHIVDLDGARGRPDDSSTKAAVASVRALVARGVAVELGGGIRDDMAVRSWLTAGVTNVILGSIAVNQAPIAAEICADHPGRVLLGLDVRNGEARAEGWTESGGYEDEHLRRWADWPAAGIIRTDISRDGMLSGPDLDGIRACIAATTHPVIASGGVSSAADVAACAEAGAAGAIVGKALYEGRVGLADLIAAFPSRELVRL